MRIQVSAFDLVDGDLDDPLRHPIALALKANTGDVWWIDEFRGVAPRSGTGRHDPAAPLGGPLLRCNVEVDAFEFEFRELGPDAYSLEPPRNAVAAKFQSALPFEKEVSHEEESNVLG